DSGARGEGSGPGEAPFKRLSNDELSKLDKYDQPRFDPADTERTLKRVRFAHEVDEFLASEGAVAGAKIAYRDGKLVSGEGYDHQVGNTDKLPTVEIAAEDYRRLTRLVWGAEAPPRAA